MFAGLAAALALASATPADNAPKAEIAKAPVVLDPIGDLIHQTETAAIDAAQAVETQVKATLYYARIKGMSAHDALGCKLAPMRTAAVDPSIFPRRSVLFIKETVGMRMPDGSKHDGFWYASDVGRAIKGLRVDLFTGAKAQSMNAFKTLNLTTLTAVRVGAFEGCPSAKSPAPASKQMAAN